MSADHQTALSNLTTLNPADAVALPTWEEARVTDKLVVELHDAMWGFQIWRIDTLSAQAAHRAAAYVRTLIADIRNAERSRCAKYVMSECVQISGDGHLYRLSGAELAAGIIALPEPLPSDGRPAPENKDFPAYGCHVEIFATVSGKPDECVIPEGNHADCIYAKGLDRPSQCEYWRKVATPPADAPTQEQSP